MPLKKSSTNKAFEHNLKAEMAAGKLQKQALAIAYSVKRRAKKMAFGGEAEHEAPYKVNVDDSFLAPEDGAETPFDVSPLSDEEELDASGFHDPEPKKTDLTDIIRNLRKRNASK